MEMITPPEGLNHFTRGFVIKDSKVWGINGICQNTLNVRKRGDWSPGTENSKSVLKSLDLLLETGFQFSNSQYKNKCDACFTAVVKLKLNGAYKHLTQYLACDECWMVVGPLNLLFLSFLFFLPLFLPCDTDSSPLSHFSSSFSLLFLHPPLLIHLFCFLFVPSVPPPLSSFP
jgi:hypothetical protein